MSQNVEPSLKMLLDFRAKLVNTTNLDYAEAASVVSSLYREFVTTFNVYPTETAETFYVGAKNKDRKLWQDQMRFVAGCAFSGCCDAHIVTMDEVDDQLKQAVQFRPTQSYTSACTFTVLPDKLTNQDEYYAFLKWLFSTDFMYLPVSLDSAVATSTQPPYDGLMYSNISPKSILNNYYIRTQLLKSMRTSSPPPAQLVYGMEWLNRNRESVPTPTSTPATGGISLGEPLGSMQGIGYQQGSSNDFSYGETLEIGQNANPGNYGETYSNMREIPWKDWGVPQGGKMCPGLKVE